MKVSDEQMEVYRRDKERQAEVEARRQRAMELARQAAQILKEEFGASRVVVFGSLLHPQRFHRMSDIDLAVWDVQHYFRGVSRLLDLEPGYEFDLVPIEDARPAIQKVIETEGVEL